MIPISSGFKFHSAACAFAKVKAAATSAKGMVWSPIGMRYLSTPKAIPLLRKYSAQSNPSWNIARPL